MEQIGSITIREYEMQESFELDNGIVASVENSQSLELTEEWIAELSQNQTFWDDMRLTAVFLNLETDGEFLTNDSGQTVYLKAGGHVYARPIPGLLRRRSANNMVLPPLLVMMRKKQV